MNEAVTKQRPSTDFEEFERFMRESTQPLHPAPHPGDGDPLSELARLVGHHPDPYHDVFAHEARDAGAMAGHEPSMTQPGQPRPMIDFAAIEAGLRGTIPAHSVDRQEAYVEQPADYYAQQRFQDQPAPQRPHASRSRRPVYTMAAVIVAGVVGIGVAFAYKGANSGPREIAMIKATPGPTKVQPAVEDAREPIRDASILDKAQQPAPTRTVSREEQPVDLAQSVQNAPRDVGNGLTPLYNFGYNSAPADAASVPVPTPPGQADDQKPMDTAADIRPIRVKTRSYRPDGTPIPNDQPPVAADPVLPAPPKADKVAVAKTSSPKVVSPKSTTRVAPKAIVTASLAEDAPTDPSAAAPRKVKPVKPVKPVKTADAADPAEDAAATQPQAAAASSGNGGFAVQLAAPGSEAEAKQTSSRLSQKFASELSGHDLSFQKAMSKGKQVYRVRVGGLSRDEANSMCEKLKTSGGSCFVAKN